MTTESKETKDKKKEKKSFNTYLMILFGVQATLFSQMKRSLKEAFLFIKDDIDNAYRDSGSYPEFEIKVSFLINENKVKFESRLEEHYRKIIKRVREVEANWYGSVKQGISTSMSKIFKEKAQKQANIIGDKFRQGIVNQYQRADNKIQALRSYSSFQELEKSKIFKELNSSNRKLIRENFSDVKSRKEVFERVKKSTFDEGIKEEIKNKSERGGYYEVKTTVEQTRFAIAKEQGMKSKKWKKVVTTEFSRESHLGLNGTTIGIDEYFIVGDSMLLYPADLNGKISDTINCLCTVEYF